MLHLILLAISKKSHDNFFILKMRSCSILVENKMERFYFQKENLTSSNILSDINSKIHSYNKINLLNVQRRVRINVDKMLCEIFSKKLCQ